MVFQVTQVPCSQLVLLSLADSSIQGSKGYVNDIKFIRFNLPLIGGKSGFGRWSSLTNFLEDQKEKKWALLRETKREPRLVLLVKVMTDRGIM